MTSDSHVSTEEVISFLGVKRRQFLERIAPRPDVPKPYVISRKNKRWPIEDVRRWLEGRRA